jgi:predicted nucleic acid-binding protein
VIAREWPAPTSKWVWDASALHHAIKADRADVLLDLANNGPDGPVSQVVTAAVVQELAGYGLGLPAALRPVNVDGLNEIVALARWVNLMSTSTYNRGEATVCAWAQVHGGLVIMDDRKAHRVATANGLRVRGTLRIAADAVSTGHLTAATASNFVDQLIAAGARYPHGPGGFLAWAQSNKLI